MKVRLVASPSDAQSIIELAAVSANKVVTQLRALPPDGDGLKALWRMKAHTYGCDPLDSEKPLNLIEQLNQTFTYIASARAAIILLARHPDAAPFTLNLGTSAGSDIQSDKSGGVAAEVFAAVHTSSNRKLAHDIKKVGLLPARFKYVFFMCPGISAGRQQPSDKHKGIEVWSVGADL